MSDDIELPLNSAGPKRPGPKPGSRKPSGAQMRATIANLDSSVGNLSREQVAHGEARAPRRSMSGADLNLYFDPKYTANPDIYYRLFIDDNRGRISKAKAAYYDHIQDENGVNLSANSGGRKMYLMGLHKKFRAEDDKLKLKNHYATIRAQETKTLGVDELEDYTDAKSKESADKFSS